MGALKHILTDAERKNYATEIKRQQHADNALLRQWRKMDFSQESFILPISDAVYRYPTFVYWKATLLKIFVTFATID